MFVKAGLVVDSSVGLIAEELGRPPFLPEEWARSMPGAVRQDAYRVAAISRCFSAPPACTTTMAIVPDQASIIWFVKRYRGADPSALLAESYDT